MSLKLETLTNNYTAQGYEQYSLTNPALLPIPLDIPKDYIAYNPSAIWTVKNQSGNDCDIMYLRVEPNRSNPGTSHLGKSFIRPYIVDIANFNQPLKPYYDAEVKMGEDPALTRINRRLSSGVIEKIWLLSCVDAQPFSDRPDHVQSLRTKFYAGTNLNSLEHIANGPEWMKDIRIAQDTTTNSTTKLHIYGRPQPESFSGNITHTTINSIEELNARAISEAAFIDESLLPIGSGIWGGVNDVISAGPDKYILAAHRAWQTGEDGSGRHYEAVLYEHNTREKRIVDLGVLATADIFPPGTIKADETLDLHDVVFTGGGYNGTLQCATFGVRDGSVGIGNIRKQ